MKTSFVLFAAALLALAACSSNTTSGTSSTSTAATTGASTSASSGTGGACDPKAFNAKACATIGCPQEMPTCINGDWICSDCSNEPTGTGGATSTSTSTVVTSAGVGGSYNP